MNVLIVGGSKGSWAMRGRQLGDAIGARYAVRPRSSDWIDADVVVVVKRAFEQHFRALQDLQVPVVWDALDFWAQPRDNDLSEAELASAVRSTAAALKVRTVIGATRAMAAAIDGVYLSHHSRIGLTPAPPRPRLSVVAYEGVGRYLGSWGPALERVCAEMGLRFVVNPPDIRDADLLVAFRGEEWDGIACRRWKSGIKHVNAIAAGRPILSQASAGFDEIRPSGVVVERPADLRAAIEHFTSLTSREAVYRQCLKRAPEFSIERIAEQYRGLLRTVVQEAA